MLQTTRVQGDYSVIGSEFINFISTVLTSRMCKKQKNVEYWMSFLMET